MQDAFYATLAAKSKDIMTMYLDAKLINHQNKKGPSTGPF
jgi:hypothetical protein